MNLCKMKINILLLVITILIVMPLHAQSKKELKKQKEE